MQATSQLGTGMADLPVIDDIEDVHDDTVRLALIGQGITDLPAALIDPAATTLDLSDNALSSAAALSRFPVLATLILDKNQLATLPADFPVLPTVTTLWLNNNRFDELSSLLDALVRLFPNLQVLSVMRNPCVPNLYFGDGGVEADAHRRYRCYVVYRLSQLVSLDATQVTEAERAEAARSGQFLQVAKPDASQYEQHHSDSLLQPALMPSTEDEEHRAKPAAYLGKGRIKYDGRQSEGNRFISNNDL